VHGALVQALGHGLLRLKHHASTDGVERVVERHDGGTGSSDRAEGGDGTERTCRFCRGSGPESA